MSGLIAGARPFAIIEESDCQLWDEEYSGAQDVWPPMEDPSCYNTLDATGIDCFAQPWWPNHSSFGGESGLSDVLVSSQDTRAPSGASGRLGFTGFTRDRFGSILPLQRVKCFLTSTGEMVSWGVSDADGYYNLTTPYSYTDAHFITTHGTNVAGATVDVLLPG
jgi:hypothetical protein